MESKCDFSNNDITGKYTAARSLGFIETPAGKIPKIPYDMNLCEIYGAFKMRINIGRNEYMVKPGIYAVGNPDSSSHVLVSANYKLSFDYLRKELEGLSAWILVIDTRGINVWCAAGKGTFGTEEIVKMIKETELHKVVDHRKVILPQLGAPGVSAHKVRKETGFGVIYGPVRASDIKEFLNAGMKANEKMRRVYFSMLNRLVLVPVEISIALKYLIISVIIFFILSGLNSSGFNLDLMVSRGIKSVFLLLVSFISGTLITPLLLPYIPGRAFSFKGFLTGSAAYIMIYLFYSDFHELRFIEHLSWFLIINVISSFLAMNFTGASTYTSLSGVKKEMKAAIPIQIAGAAAGLILFIISLFI